MEDASTATHDDPQHPRREGDCVSSGGWCRRLALLALLGGLLGLLLLTSAAATIFPDVPDDHPYVTAIQDLADRGIILGFADGTFGPGEPVLRQQFAKMILLSLGHPVTEQDVCFFGDVEVSGPGSLYPDNYVAVAAQRGITLGTSPETFSPYRTISRYQVITMVMRAVDELSPGPLAPPPADYTSTWDPAGSPDHGLHARRAEYHGLLAGLPLPGLDPWGPMPRGEVAQVLHNLLQKLPSSSTTTEQTTTTEPDTPTTEPGPETVPIEELKGPEWERYLGRVVTVEGIFVRDPLPMLVTDLEVYRANSRMPEQGHLMLVGPEAEEIDPERHGGALLRVTGRVISSSSEFGAGRQRPEAQVGAEARLAALPVLYPVLAEVSRVEVLERLVRIDPKFIDLDAVPNPFPDPERWAVLFSGADQTAYWNEPKFMYSTLVGPLGFPADNIAVLYADGTAKEPSMPVHYAATEANLATVFDLLREHSHLNDLVFVLVVGHGGGFNTGAWGPYCISGGMRDYGLDEPSSEALSETLYWFDANQDGYYNTIFRWDEAVCTWQPAYPFYEEMLDDSLGTIVEDLEYERMVVLFGQSYGGGQIHDVAGSGNKILISAAGEHAPSYSSPDGNHVQFIYPFISAVNKADAKGSPVDADTNKDGKVSVVEAFNYARSADPLSDPWYEDSGDGIPHSGAMPGSGEGMLGADLSLEP